MNKPVPYYKDSACTIYHGDCREILPLLEPVDPDVEAAGAGDYQGDEWEEADD